MMVMLAELEGGGSSVARVLESPGNIRIKNTARSEAKHRKRSLFIVLHSIPQSPLDNHNPFFYSIYEVVDRR